MKKSKDLRGSSHFNGKFLASKKMKYKCVFSDYCDCDFSIKRYVYDLKE